MDSNKEIIDVVNELIAFNSIFKWLYDTDAW